jgi:hypothetical protein
MNVPALAARAPPGATYVATGTGEARMSLMISRIEVSRTAGRVGQQHDELRLVTRRALERPVHEIGARRTDRALQRHDQHGGASANAGAIHSASSKLNNLSRTREI